MVVRLGVLGPERGVCHILALEHSADDRSRVVDFNVRRVRGPSVKSFEIEITLASVVGS